MTPWNDARIFRDLGIFTIKHDFLAVFGSKNAFFDFQIPKMARKLVFLSKNVQNICFYGSLWPNEAS